MLKASGLGDSLATILSQLDMPPILLAWLVAIVLHAAVGSATVAMMGATLNETLKYYTTATFVASLMALAGTFLLSFIV